MALANESIVAFTEPPIVNCVPGVRPPKPAILTIEPFVCFGIG